MSSLGLKENDIYFGNGRLVLITGSNTDAEILQRVKVRLRFFLGEWFLNTDHGIPYFQDILGTKNLNLDVVQSLFQSEILDVEGVSEMITSLIDYDEKQRKVLYTFEALTINNILYISFIKSAPVFSS